MLEGNFALQFVFPNVPSELLEEDLIVCIYLLT